MCVVWCGVVWCGVPLTWLLVAAMAKALPSSDTGGAGMGKVLSTESAGWACPLPPAALAVAELGACNIMLMRERMAKAVGGLRKRCSSTHWKYTVLTIRCNLSSEWYTRTTGKPSESLQMTTAQRCREQPTRASGDESVPNFQHSATKIQKFLVCGCSADA
jgi:hypothetical protein